jgi:hypothetical protein
VQRREGRSRKTRRPRATLLAVFDTYYQSADDLFGGDLGAPKPGMPGLGSTAAEKKFADCVAAGGSWESCGGAK